MNDTRSGKITLLEVVVVLAIGCILLGLLVPAIQTGGPRRRSVCANNLKQMALAAVQYETSFGQLPGYLQMTGRWQPPVDGGLSDSADPDNQIKIPHWKIASWHIILLPYLDSQATYERWVEDKYPLLADGATQQRHEDGYHSQSVPKLPIYDCPNSTSELETGRNCYVSNNGLFDLPNPAVNQSQLTFEQFCTPAYGAFNNRLPPYFEGDLSKPMAKDAQVVSTGPAVTMDDFRDGPSNTILFAESNHALPYHYLSRDLGDAKRQQSLILIEPENYLSIAESKCTNGMVYTWMDDPDFAIETSLKKPTASKSEDPVLTLARIARPSSEHASGFNAAFADGQVRYVVDSIDAITYRQLLTLHDRSSKTGNPYSPPRAGVE